MDQECVWRINAHWIYPLIASFATTNNTTDSLAVPICTPANFISFTYKHSHRLFSCSAYFSRSIITFSIESTSTIPDPKRSPATKTLPALIPR